MDVTTLAMAKKYTDSQRVAYTEEVITEVFAKRELQFVENEAFGGVPMAVLESPIGIKNDTKYRVEFDGNIYECVGISYEEDGVVIQEVLGNGALGGNGEDNGQPFYYFYVNLEEAILCAVVAEQSGTHTLSISSVIANHHKLHRNLLPVYNLDLTTTRPAGTSFDVALNDEDNEKIDEVADDAHMICVRIGSESHTLTRDYSYGNENRFGNRIVSSGAYDISFRVAELFYSGGWRLKFSLKSVEVN